MDVAESLQSTPINPNNFPAKLWHLVNSPHYQSIYWDARGEGFIIDKPLFESELLRPSGPKNEASDWFKTTNFSSFIRQLNLYGFRKLVSGSVVSPNSHHPGGDVGAGDGHLHHFYSAYFRKGHPELLVNLKRMTSSNKAKMAAGLQVNSRPPNRFQRLLAVSLADAIKGENQGPMIIEQDHRVFRRDCHSPYFYGSPVSGSYIGFPLKELDRTPIPPRTWPSPFGMLQGQLDSQSSFPGNNIIFPVLQCFPAEVSYTLSASPTSVQGHSAMSGAVQQYGSYSPPPAQYSHPYYPAAVLPCCTSQTHMERLVSRSGSPFSSYPHCNYFQSPPPMQSSIPMELFRPTWPSSDSEKDEMSLETVFRFVDELRSSPLLEMVKLNEDAQTQSSPLKNKDATVTLSPENDDGSSGQTNQLEFLEPENTGVTPYDLGSSQSVVCHVPQASVHHTTADMNTSSNASDKTLAVEKEKLHVSEVPLLVTELVQHKDLAETGQSLKVDKLPDLSLLVDVVCRHEQVTKEDALGE